METGNLVELIDKEKILCAVVTDAKSLRVKLLTENNRELKVSVNRLCHKGRNRLDLGMGRERLVEELKAIAGRRRLMAEKVNVLELWEVLHQEQEWIDLATMTELCFDKEYGDDHESAVLRAFFKDRLYFKFSCDRFFPNSEKRVEQIREQERRKKEEERLLLLGIRLLKGVENPDAEKRKAGGDFFRTVEILKSYFLFEKESQDAALARAMLKGAGKKDPDVIFDTLVGLGIWSSTENVELLRLKIPVEFPIEVVDAERRLLDTPPAFFSGTGSSRKDLTDLACITIDGQSTLDFDDAVSIEHLGDEYLLGVHIADVSHFIGKGDQIDCEAQVRSSAIYMPDLKIPMIPRGLAENICSLKENENRPAITVMVRLSRDKNIVSYDIFPSLIRVKSQRTYYDVNQMAEHDEEMALLLEIGRNFRQTRLSQGGVYITLPEVSVWLDSNGEPVVHRMNRESPSRVIVSEIMIMANWLMARYLREQGLCAVFRSQQEPKQRLYSGEEESLFKNWMQRKQLARFVLTPDPEPHAGLGLEVYLTATSPIRKYVDLVTQRQIRAALGMEEAYSREEVEEIIQRIKLPMADVTRLQSNRNRFWLLTYIKSLTGSIHEAVVLYEKKNSYMVLVKEFMIEAELPKVSGLKLKKEDVCNVTIGHVNPRKNILNLFLS